MSAILYRGYDKAGLDREYDNRTKVPGFDFAGFLRECEEQSERARTVHDCVLDVPYGDSPAERLDIFRTSKPGPPVHVFFHGGYWRMLDKKDFSYIANGLVPHDVTVVVVNYALIPTVGMDELIAQCRRSLRWVAENIAAYGGDPNRISISGHSAGGHIVAMMLASEWQPPLIKHACAISGIFELEPIQLCFLNEILDLQPGVVARNSPRFLSRKTWCPFTVAVGDREGDEYLRQSNEFGVIWNDASNPVNVAVLSDEDHFSIRAQYGNPDSDIVALALGLR